MTNFTFYKIDIPGGPGAGGFTYISVTGIDATGLAVGNFGDTDGDWHGFTVAKGGSVTTYDPPTSSNNTDVVGITAAGEVFGDFTDWTNVQHGFIEDGGVTTTIDIPLLRCLATTWPPLRRFQRRTWRNVHHRPTGKSKQSVGNAYVSPRGRPYGRCPLSRLRPR